MCTVLGAWNTNINKQCPHPQTQIIYLEEKHISPSIPCGDNYCISTIDRNTTRNRSTKDSLNILERFHGGVNDFLIRTF